MPEYSRILGDVVKVARGKSGLTQAEVAVAIHRDTRTVLNIENYKGNPKLEVLYPLVRTLNIDAREIFNPEMQLDSPALRLLVNDCSEEEAAAIIPIFQAALRLARNQWPASIKYKQSLTPIFEWEAGFAFLRLAHLLIAIFSCITSILISFLHLGQ